MATGSDLHGYGERACEPLAESGDLGDVYRALQRVRECMQEWEASTFGLVCQELAKLRRELEQVWERTIGVGPPRREKQLMTRISELLSREEMMEKQRSRMDWLKEGDRNTSFYQAKARERAQTNKIASLLLADGSFVTEQEDLEVEARSFYMNLFTAQQDLEPKGILQHVPVKVTADMNSALLREYTTEEVKKALFMMGASKAPGPDDFHAGFYQRHWETVGPSITKAVIDFLNGGRCRIQLIKLH